MAARYGRPSKAGRLVLHRRKPLRGAERAAHRQPVTVDHEMTGGNTIRRAPVQTLSKQQRRALRAQTAGDAS